MLKDAKPVATVAVKDIKAARKFYEDTLGLSAVDASQPTVVTYRAGPATLLVYESQFAGTNKATAVTWSVGAGVEAVVQALAAKGVAFEHYDFPGLTRKGDLHVAGDMKVAWLKDPDGNIHSLINR
jgi:catechol 2,3-dioxygenase-like lactoylglutathione lyase family enzyme